MQKQYKSSGLHKRSNHLLSGCVAIFVLWFLLYIPNLRTAPHWYGDEILTLDIGKAIVRGEFANRAVYSTFFSPNYNYQPIFAGLTGLASYVTGGDILGGRILSASIGLLTALLGFTLVSRKWGVLWGLFFATTLLGYSQSLIHYRWIYPHNLVGLSVLGATILLTHSATHKNDWKIGAFLATGACGHLLAIHATAACLLCRLKRPGSWLPIALPPGIVFATSLLVVWSVFGNWLFEDLAALRELYQRYSIENGQGIKKFFNFYNFFSQDFFHIATALGCLLCLRKPTYPIAIIGLFLTFLLTQNRQNLPLFYYQAMAVLPVLVLALTLGLRQATVSVASVLQCKEAGKRFIPSLALAASLINCVIAIPKSLSGTIPTRIDPWVVSSPSDYEVVAKWINENTSPDDLVITYWTLGWLLQCKTADILTATAWSGKTAGDYYPNELSRDRFRYNADIQSAKYVVVTDLDAWAFAQGNSLNTINSAGVSSWPIVFKHGTSEVYENPRYRINN